MLGSPYFWLRFWTSCQYMRRKCHVAGSPTGLVVRIMHSRRPLAPASLSRECAPTRATLSRSQADPVFFLLTKTIREPGYLSDDIWSRDPTPGRVSKARTEHGLCSCITGCRGNTGEPLFIRSCELRYNLCVTVVVPLEYDLGVQFAPLHPHQECHPNEDLRQRDWQAEPVEEIMIATRPAF